MAWPQEGDANDQPEEALQEPMADELVSLPDFINFGRDKMTNKALTGKSFKKQALNEECLQCQLLLLSISRNAQPQEPQRRGPPSQEI